MKILQLLLSKGYDNYSDIMIYACKGGQLQIVEDMLQRGADGYGIAYHTAVMYGHVVIAEKLLQYCFGDDSHAYCAGECGNMDMVHFLEETEGEMFEYQSLLYGAVRHKHEEITRYAICNGALLIAFRLLFTVMISILLKKF